MSFYDEDIEIAYRDCGLRGQMSTVQLDFYCNVDTIHLSLSDLKYLTGLLGFKVEEKNND